MKMNLSDISNLRLINQQVNRSRFISVKELIGWMGAIQAQDYNMAKLAVGVRLANSTDHIIEKAVDDGEILRTHVLRPTWHFISPDNVSWMLQLTSDRIKASVRPRDIQLGLNETIFEKSNRIIEETLKNNQFYTRDELAEVLNFHQIDTDEYRISHLIMRAELEGIICNGRIKSGKQTYSLLKERVSVNVQISREEALGKLARIYFSSHGPATIADFVWWSGLTVGECRKAVDIAKSELTSLVVEGNTYWFSPEIRNLNTKKDSLFLLPAFDEFIISYRDRLPSLPATHFNKAVFSNGIFRPVIVLNGTVIGTWQRSQKKNRIEAKANYFYSPDSRLKEMVEREFASLGTYWGTPVIVTQL